MSLYDDASLVMIPSGIKDGKLYSVKPDDGVGDFTFTRGSNLAATTVNENGLIEKGRENLLLQSNQFDTTWTNSNSSETSGQSGYDGSSDAWLITKNDAFGFIKQAISSSGTQTFSVYAKASDSDWIRLYVNGVGSLVYFNLSTGVVGGASSVIDSNIDSIGNGWYRCSIAFSGNTTEVYIYPAEENSVSATSGSVYIQDAQLELGLVATDYIETGATTEQAGILENLPRLDYSDSSCPSLLLEPTRSNLFLQSEYFDGIEWSTTRCDIDSNLLTSPEGLINASKMTSTDVNESYVEELITTTLTKTTFSFFAKKGDIDYVHGMFWDGVANGCRQWFNVNTGVTGGTTTFGSGYSVDSSSIQDFGNGWYRCIMTVNSSAGSNRCRLNISSADTVITSPVSSYGYFYGAQVEEGSYPTSYIPTYGTSVTRSGDLCFGAGDSTTFNDSEGVLFVEVALLNELVNDARISISDGASIENRITFSFLDDNELYVQIGYTSGFAETVTLTSTEDYNKIALVYDSLNASLFVNGSKVVTNTMSALNGLSQLQFGRFVTTSNFFYGKIKQIAVYDTALTDSELAALTTI